MKCGLIWKSMGPCVCGSRDVMDVYDAGERVGAEPGARSDAGAPEKGRRGRWPASGKRRRGKPETEAEVNAPSVEAAPSPPAKPRPGAAESAGELLGAMVDFGTGQK